jgi:hypothetical protein
VSVHPLYWLSTVAVYLFIASVLCQYILFIGSVLWQYIFLLAQYCVSTSYLLAQYCVSISSLLAHCYQSNNFIVSIMSVPNLHCYVLSIQPLHTFSTVSVRPLYWLSTVPVQSLLSHLSPRSCRQSDTRYAFCVPPAIERLWLTTVVRPVGDLDSVQTCLRCLQHFYCSSPQYLFQWRLPLISLLAYVFNLYKKKSVTKIKYG